MITKQLPNEEFIPFVISELESVEGKTVTLPLRGRSMRPFLEDGRDNALLICDKNINVNDAVLAEIAPKRFLGDGNLSPEHCTLKDIKAKAIGFYRKGRKTADMTSGLKWRIYSWWWTRLYPIRRYLLFILHPHIPARFKK